MSELVKIEEQNALQLFSKEDGLKPVLDEIKKEVESFDPDISTDKGRKAIASLANKVARSKTYLDGLGKDLVSDWKNKAKVVDAERRKVREFLDDLKVTARKPLTEYEEEQERRAAAILEKMNSIKQYQDIEYGENTLDELEGYKLDLSNIDYSELPESYQEKATKEVDKSNIYLDGLISKLKAQIEAEEKAERERKEAEEKARKEREEELKRQAAEEAEAKAKEAEQRALEAEKRAKEAEEEAKRREVERLEREKQAKIEAEKRAEEAAERARLAEIKRAEEEKELQRVEKEKREANKRHIGKIRKEAKESLMKHCDLSETDAKKVVMAIHNNSIKNVGISY